MPNSAKRISLLPDGLYWLAIAMVLAGCAGKPRKDIEPDASILPPGKVAPATPVLPSGKPGKGVPRPKPLTGRELVSSLLPPSLPDKNGWAADIIAVFEALNIPTNKENTCAVLAEIEQESAFQTEPQIPGLTKIVRQTLEANRIKYGIPQWAMEHSLSMKSPTGKTYNERIETLKTENEVNDLYEDMISEIPLGKQLLSDHNPVRTVGPMQVNVDFAKAYSTTKRYPFANGGTLRNALFTRKGGLYFGVAYLLDYPASYTSVKFRFADYNAGLYSSRNAALQKTVSSLSGIPLRLDGDLLRYRDGVALEETSQSMRAMLAIASRLNMGRKEIFRDLLLEKSYAFERSPLYTGVLKLAPTMPRAHIPEIIVDTPKALGKLTTASYVERVDGRYRNCLKK